MLQISEQEIV